MSMGFLGITDDLQKRLDVPVVKACFQYTEIPSPSASACAVAARANSVEMIVAVGSP